MNTETTEIFEKSSGLMKKIDEGTELDQYFVINEIGGFSWRMQHEYYHGRIMEEDWQEIQKDIVRLSVVQRHAVSLLTRFGVTKPFRDEKNRPSAEYWAWFRWWDAYIKGLSQEGWEELDRRYRAKEDLSAYRPTGDWREQIPKEEETIRRAEEFQAQLSGSGTPSKP